MSELSWWGAELLGRGNPGTVWAQAGAEVSAGTLRREVRRLAGVLRCYGIGAGSTVALTGTPSFTQLWTLFALWSLDAQVLMPDPALTREETEPLLTAAAPQFTVESGARYEGLPVFVDECEVLVRRRADGRPARTPHCLVQFSSGTSGRPKAVGRTAQSLLTEVERLRSVPGMARAGERVAVLEPVARSFPLVAGVLYSLACGATVVFPRSRTGPAVAEAAARSHVVLGTPRHIRMLTEAPGELRLPRLRVAVSGGDALCGEVAGAFTRRFGVLVGQAYGTTETGLVAADLLGGAGPDVLGRPVPGLRTRLRGGILEVHVPQSPYVYGADPWPGGWMSTQDLVTRHPATGVLRRRGRIGEETVPLDVDPLAIESVLRAHGQVKDAVVFASAPVEAHVAVAADVPDGALSAWCRRFLGPEATPRYFHVVRELPRTASGKLLRDRARLHGLGWSPRPAGRAEWCR